MSVLVINEHHTGAEPENAVTDSSPFQTVTNVKCTPKLSAWPCQSEYRTKVWYTFELHYLSLFHSKEWDSYASLLTGKEIAKQALFPWKNVTNVDWPRLIRSRNHGVVANAVIQFNPSRVFTGSKLCKQPHTTPCYGSKTMIYMIGDVFWMLKGEGGLINNFCAGEYLFVPYVRSIACHRFLSERPYGRLY